MRPYNIHTDLACESEATHDAGKGGTAYTEREEGGFRVAKLQVKNTAGEAATGKKCGSYVTVFTELLCDESDARLDTLAALIAAEIEALAARRSACWWQGSATGRSPPTASVRRPWTV